MIRKIVLEQKTEDEIREIVLSYFYEIYKNATGMKALGLGIRQIKKDLRNKNLLSKEVVRNVEYLVQTGYLKREEELSHFPLKSGKGMLPSKKIIYKISNLGIFYFEGPTKFQKMTSKYDRINISNIHGIVQLGDGNIVNETYRDLYSSLMLLGAEIRECVKLNDQEKLELQAEIETIKSQLAKSEPDKNIIKKAWEKLQLLNTFGGAINFLSKTGILLKSIFGI